MPKTANILIKLTNCNEKEAEMSGDAEETQDSNILANNSNNMVISNGPDQVGGQLNTGLTISPEEKKPTGGKTGQRKNRNRKIGPNVSGIFANRMARATKRANQRSEVVPRFKNKRLNIRQNVLKDIFGEQIANLNKKPLFEPRSCSADENVQVRKEPTLDNEVENLAQLIDNVIVKGVANMVKLCNVDELNELPKVLGPWTPDLGQSWAPDKIKTIAKSYLTWEDLAAKLGPEPKNTSGKDEKKVFKGFGPNLLLTKTSYSNGFVDLKFDEVTDEVMAETAAYLEEAEENEATLVKAEKTRKRMAANFDLPTVANACALANATTNAKTKATDHSNSYEHRDVNQSGVCSNFGNLNLNARHDENEGAYGGQRREDDGQSDGQRMFEHFERTKHQSKKKNPKSCKREGHHGRDSERTGTTSNGIHGRYCVNGQCVRGGFCQLFNGVVPVEQIAEEVKVNGLMSPTNRVRVEGKGKVAILEDHELVQTLLNELVNNPDAQFSPDLRSRIINTHGLVLMTIRNKLVMFDVVARLASKFDLVYSRRFVDMLAHTLASANIANAFLRTRYIREDFMTKNYDLLGNDHIRSVCLVIRRRVGEAVTVLEMIRIANRADLLTDVQTKEMNMGMLFKLATTTSPWARAMAKRMFAQVDEEAKRAIMTKAFDFEVREWDDANQYWQMRQPLHKEREILQYWADEFSWRTVMIRLWIETTYMVGPIMNGSPIDVNLLAELEDNVLEHYNTLDVNQEFDLLFLKDGQRRRIDWPTYTKDEAETKPTVARQARYYKNQIEALIRFVRDNRAQIVATANSGQWVSTMIQTMNAFIPGERLGSALNEHWFWLQGEFDLDHDYQAPLPAAQL